MTKCPCFSVNSETSFVQLGFEHTAVCQYTAAQPAKLRPGHSQRISRHFLWFSPLPGEHCHASAPQPRTPLPHHHPEQPRKNASGKFLPENTSCTGTDSLSKLEPVGILLGVCSVFTMKAGHSRGNGPLGISYVFYS